MAGLCRGIADASQRQCRHSGTGLSRRAEAV
jgi:hypothetical protein